MVQQQPPTPITGAADIDPVPDIADFLDQGYADTIAAMFRQDPSLYGLTGKLLEDERFMVRLGVAVLFEELVATRPDDVHLALACLAERLQADSPTIRGEAANILGIIGSQEARRLIEPLRRDPDPQVATIIKDFLDDADGQVVV